MKTNYLTMMNKQIRWLSFGDETKPLIIGLHGLGGSAYTFYELSDHLKDYHLVSIDLPGHGQSDDLDTDFSPEYLMPWLSSVIDAITTGPFFLLAHSWGASVALHYCVENHNRVKKVMLLDGGYHDSEVCYAYFGTKYNNGEMSHKPFMCFEDEVAYYEDDFDLFRYDDFDTAVKAEMDNSTRQNGYIKKMIEDLIISDQEQYIWHVRGKTAKKALLFQYHSQKTLKFDQLKSDILLIYPDQPSAYKTLREKQIKVFNSKYGIQVQLYENTSHMIHYDQPEKLAIEITQFF